MVRDTSLKGWCHEPSAHGMGQQTHPMGRKRKLENSSYFDEVSVIQSHVVRSSATQQASEFQSRKKSHLGKESRAVILNL
ncbi:hypothetical protein JTE90_003898 [Oedothorax gibbosus]|uniref:Uncharacterized protein n=1 Tax=Oedothorax gibbosus TaxID=931172 RepID=A0AAV6UIU9_9ARAC|nr:hypothetical protein JTE90_003898 [Oedothorax gibbosus]